MNPEWWSFQGASYKWGDDFVFPLPESFSRENYMGLNALKQEEEFLWLMSGIKSLACAVAYLGDKPADISLPVKVENNEISV